MTEDQYKKKLKRNQKDGMPKEQWEKRLERQRERQWKDGMTEEQWEK